MVPQGLSERGVLVDSSAMFGLVDRRDQWHHTAVQGFRRLWRERRPAHSTNLAVAEAHGLIASRVGTEAALRWLGSLGAVRVFYHTREDDADVLRILRAFPRSDFSYADAFSFLVMERLGTRTAFTFDHHFADYGWDLF